MTMTMTMVAVSWVLRVAVVVTFALLIDIITATTSVSVDASSDPGGGGGDGACLSLLRSSLEDPNNSLRNWTKQNLAKPCPGFDSQSYLLGATCNNGRIFKLSLSNLYLRGTLSPNSISQCSNLQSLDLSSNSLSGEIPNEIFNNGLLNLAVLNLSSNQFSGPIPPQLSLCTYLNVIDLHNNQLSGSIPQQLGSLARLSVFDVSNNRLSGMIPPSLGGTGRGSPRFNASSFEGNKGLYGYPLDPNYNSNDSTSRNNKGGGLSVMAIVGIGLGSGLLSLLVSFTVVCIWLRVSERKMADSAHHQAGKITHLMPEY